MRRARPVSPGHDLRGNRAGRLQEHRRRRDLEGIRRRHADGARSDDHHRPHGHEHALCGHVDSRRRAEPGHLQEHRRRRDLVADQQRIDRPDLLVFPGRRRRARVRPAKLEDAARGNDLLGDLQEHRRRSHLASQDERRVRSRPAGLVVSVQSRGARDRLRGEQQRPSAEHRRRRRLGLLRRLRNALLRDRDRHDQPVRDLRRRQYRFRHAQEHRRRESLGPDEQRAADFARKLAAHQHARRRPDQSFDRLRRHLRRRSLREQQRRDELVEREHRHADRLRRRLRVRGEPEPDRRRDARRRRLSEPGRRSDLDDPQRRARPFSDFSAGARSRRSGNRLCGRVRRGPEKRRRRADLAARGQRPPCGSGRRDRHRSGKPGEVARRYSRRRSLQEHRRRRDLDGVRPKD